MSEICEIVPSQKGNNKIKVHGYLMVKERNRENIYYWCCEKQKLENYKGRTITNFSNDSYYFQKSVDHNHSFQASNGDIANTVVRIKQQTKKIRD